MATMANVSEGFSDRIEAVKGWPQRVKTYIEGLRMEMRRVTWPNKKQVRATTVVVIVTVFLFGFYFFVVDTFLNYLMSRVFGFFSQ
jgi:preprotein translocase subunit SecE